MAHIRKRKIKRGIAHEVYWSDGNTPHSKYFPPEVPLDVVKRFAAKVEHDKAFERVGVELPKSAITLSRLRRLYIEKRMNEIDPAREALALDQLIAYLGDIPAERVTHSKLDEFRDALLHKRMKPDAGYEDEQRVRRGANKELKIIRTVFNWAYTKELIKSKPFEKVSFYREDENIPDVLTRQEVQLIYRNLPRRGPSRMVFNFMRYTGRRRSEILRLRGVDLDMDSGTMRLLKAKNRRPSVRPIHPKLLRILRWIKVNTESEEPLFKITPMALTRNFRRTMQRLGISKKMPTHILRHTFGARVIERYLTTGDAERIAQEALGHKDRKMTRHYTQIVKSQLGQAIADVDL